MTGIVDAALANLLSPVILSFWLGLLAGVVRSDLQIPDAITDVLDNVLIVVITREELAPPLLEQLMTLLEDRVGIVSVSDVEVFRAGHF